MPPYRTIPSNEEPGLAVLLNLLKSAHEQI
jgi:hypothetical protein